MADNQEQSIIQKFSDFFKKSIFVITGIITLYLGWYIVKLFFFHNNRTTFLGEGLINSPHFSHMISILVIYFLILFIVFLLYRKTKTIMLKEYNKNLDVVRERAVLQTTQKLSALMIQYISSYNAEIQQWLMHKQEQGQMPDVVAQASKNISTTLLNFSRLAFIMPYLDKNFNSDEYLQSDYKNAFLQLPYRKEL